MTEIVEIPRISFARDFAGKPCLLDIVPMYMPTEKLPLMRTIR